MQVYCFLVVVFLWDLGVLLVIFAVVLFFVLVFFLDIFFRFRYNWTIIFHFRQYGRAGMGSQGTQ